MEQQQVSFRIALDIYRDTLNLLKCVTSAFKRSQKSETGDSIPANDHKLIALSYRCQSLLTLKMSRLRGKELRDNHKMIQANSPDVPVAAKEVTLPVAVYATMKKQLALYAEQSSSLDLWSSAEFLIQKYPSCKAFFRTIDLETGSLSLSSSFDELVTYVRTALRIIHWSKQEKHHQQVKKCVLMMTRSEWTFTWFVYKKKASSKWSSSVLSLLLYIYHTSSHDWTTLHLFLFSLFHCLLRQEFSRYT